jgi:hypothetical protein
MRHSTPARTSYPKLPDLHLVDSGAMLGGKSLLKSMKDYQGFWKPVDLRKRQGQLEGKGPRIKSKASD